VYIYIHSISAVHYILGTTRTTVVRGSGRMVAVVAEDVAEAVVKVEAAGTLGYPSSCFHRVHTRSRYPTHRAFE